MSKAWQTLASIPTREGALELRQRGDAEFLIVIAGRILMTSAARQSEEALATLVCAQLKNKKSPRIFIGGLGMAFTLRAALDALSPTARVVVGELTAEVVDWCRGPLATVTGNAVADPRVKIEIGDASRLIADARAGEYDAILIDLYEGPHAATQRSNDPFYGSDALVRTHTALAKNGIFAVWSEEPDASFARRFAAAGFSVSTHRAGKGGRSHVIYIGARD